MDTKLETPNWVKNAVFYQIFPDRFASSKRVSKPVNLEAWYSAPTVHGFKGGDLLGIVEHLGYLEDLGINAIYLNPIFQSSSNHRYHTHDYFKVDPLLGGDAAFYELLDRAHRHGIRIILDGVFNHASRGFFQFNHVLECGASSPYVDWFDVTSFPLNAYSNEPPNYRSWMNLPALPEFNLKNPQVRKFLLDVARYWLQQGIDGWRLDVPYCIDEDNFWQEFRQVVKSENPEAYIVGEVATEAQRWLNGDQFDAVMNYQFTQACLGFFGGSLIDRELESGMMGLPSTQVLDAPAFAKRMEELVSIYPWDAVLAQMNLLDSHDMPRFLALLGGDKALLRLAVLHQMTFPGAPSVYYGDEIAIKSGRTQTPEDSRYAFPWDAKDQWDNELLDFYRQCIALRKAHPALRTGEYKTLLAEDGIYAYIRRNSEDTLVVIINNSPRSYLLDIPVAGYLREGAHLHNLTSNGVARVVDGKITRLALSPFSGVVFSQ